MDIYCARCGEPWDMDSLHEAAEEQERSFDQVAADFRARGCVAFGWGPVCSASNDDEPDQVYGLTRAAAASALYEVLGDDMDGAAAEFEDLFG